MRKLFLALFLVLAVSTLAACDLINPDDGLVDQLPDDIKDKLPDDVKDNLQKFEGCNGNGDYVVVEGVCYPMNELVSPFIHIKGEETVVNYSNAIEMMDDFVADLSGSTGLAVVNRDMYNRQSGVAFGADDGTEGEEPETDNVIVKLTEDGFFEEVSFTDDAGFSVQLLANPLALEIYGDFTVVIFEVDHGWDEYQDQSFDQKVWDSYHSGGIYLIHNETGKLFSTKEVVFEENSWVETYWEDRVITVTVKLGEPIVEMREEKVLDENGEPVLDADGNQVFEMIEKQILDADGNPIIFNEGPIVTEMVEIPLVEYYEQPVVEVTEEKVLDENGDPVLDEEGNEVFETIETPVLDENGNQVYEIIEVPVLDENGNPIIEMKEQPVLDENGEVVMVQEFEIDIQIQEEIEITHEEYYAHIQNNPLSSLAERFVQKVMEEYFNWNYYRVNDYVLWDHNFTYTDEVIYYTEYEHDTQSRIVKKMYFDDLAEEIVIVDYMDISKAGFENCEIFVEPINGTIVCNPWDGNVKIFSETNGLKTIADSEHLQAVVLPNGELYFFNNNYDFVEELGYNTVTLYTINADGTMNSSYVELAETVRYCHGECNMGFQVSFMDGEEEYDLRHESFSFASGTPWIDNAEAHQIAIGEFDSTMPVCDNAEGCHYEYEVLIVDGAGEVVTRSSRGGTYYPNQTPPSFSQTFLMDNEAVVHNRQQHSDIQQFCELEIGCSDDMYFRDPSIGQHGATVWTRVLVDQNDALVNRIELNDTNEAVYEYEKTTSSEVCAYTEGCDRWVPHYFYIDGELILQYDDYVQVAQGELIPLFVEYTSSDDTQIVYRTQTCQYEGCSEVAQINDGGSWWLNYEEGDVMLQSVVYAETDRTEVTENTEVRDFCTDVNGCWYNDVTYVVTDTDGTVLYEFSNGMHIEYGYKAAFKVTVSIDDCTVEYDKQWLNQDQVCEDEVCNETYGIVIEQSNGNHDWVAWVNKQYAQGETIIDRIVIDEDKLQSESFEKVCNNQEGCIVYTENFTFLLEDGTDVTFDHNDEWWTPSVPVFFEFGALMPGSSNNWEAQDFEVTFELRDLEYQTYRMDPWEFRDGLNNMSRLDDNLYLLEKNSWMEGEFNYILTFDAETNRYRVQYTNMSTILEITPFNNSFIAINEDKTAILQYTYDETLSNPDFYYFTETNLTEGLELNGVNDLIVDYDGSIYFKGVDNFLNDITGFIDEFGVVNVDTEYNEPDVVRVRPIN